MSGPLGDRASPLAARLTAYYREVAETHADDPVIGLCPQCRVHRCAEYRFAVERLAMAGEPAPEPPAAPP